MSKRCPECNFANDDSRIFCSACGAPLDANIRLIQGFEKQSKTSTQPKEAPRKKDDDDDDYIPPRTEQKKGNGALPWIILGVVAVVAVALWFFLH